jgi:hypothetical protein
MWLVLGGNIREYAVWGIVINGADVEGMNV